jgi:hypothetical protein
MNFSKVVFVTFGGVHANEKSRMQINEILIIRKDILADHQNVKRPIIFARKLNFGIIEKVVLDYDLVLTKKKLKTIQSKWEHKQFLKQKSVYVLLIVFVF